MKKNIKNLKDQWFSKVNKLYTSGRYYIYGPMDFHFNSIKSSSIKVADEVFDKMERQNERK